MVKANGYGLGAVAVARALESLDPWGYGVASVEEGAALRAAGITRPVLVVSPLLPDAIDAHLAHDLRPTIGDLPALDGLVRPRRTAVPRRDRHRDGRAPASAGTTRRRSAAAAALLSAPTDGKGCSPTSTARTPIRLRRGAVGSIPGSAGGAAPPARRWCMPPTAGPRSRAERFAGDLMRPGIFLYGGAAGADRARGRWPRSGHASWRCGDRRRRDRELRRHLARAARDDGRHARPGICRRISPGRARRTGGAPVGVSRGSVELNGALVPVVGRVTMDMTMVDAGERRPALGDVATIYGGRVSLDQQAAAAGTIAYELLTALSPRVPRRYGREP